MKRFKKKMWASAWDKFQSTSSNDSEWTTTPEILAMLKAVAGVEQKMWKKYRTETRAKKENRK